MIIIFIAFEFHRREEQDTVRSRQFENKVLGIRRIVMRKGYSLIEIVIVMLIIAILGAATIVVGSKQVARSRVQDAITFVQTMESNIEEGITDLGFLEDVNYESNSVGITTYLKELEDIYLNCYFNYDSVKAIPALPDGYGDGFQVDISSPEDPWGMYYTMFYMKGTAKDNYRIVFASPGPNNFWNEAGYASGYVAVGISGGTDLIDDDVIDIMVSR